MGRRFVIGAALVAALSCSSSAPRPAPRDRAGDEAGSGSRVRADEGPSDAAPWLIDPPADGSPPSPQAGCPASYAAAMAATGTCSFGDLCSYNEGSCTCSTPPHCGGDAAPDDLPRGWQCEPVTRADGCPGRTPTEGSACQNANQVCDYTCSCTLTATCRKRRWVLAHGECKP